LLVIGIVAGALLLALLIVWAFSGSSQPPPGPGPTDPAVKTRLVVNADGKDGAFRKLSEALRAARPGATIVVQDDMLQEQLELYQTKQVTIEAESGKQVLWQAPRTPVRKYLLSISSVEKVRLRGFTFDGKGLVDEIFLLVGECPGLTLENLQLRGFTRSAIRVMNCAGRPAGPVSLRELTISTSKKAPAAISFETSPNIQTPKSNQYISIRGCRFEGLYDTPIQPFNRSGSGIVDWDTNLVQKPNQPAVELKLPE
jgi:hypothetical protein